MNTSVEHKVTINPTPDSDGCINWHCTCGETGQDYDRDEAQDSAEMHMNGQDTIR